jgi:hypothetical protein
MSTPIPEQLVSAQKATDGNGRRGNVITARSHQIDSSSFRLAKQAMVSRLLVEGLEPEMGRSMPFVKAGGRCAFGFFPFSAYTPRVECESWRSGDCPALLGEDRSTFAR